jgi:hypothetical protein
VKKPGHPPGIARFDREYNEWNDPREQQLFKRGDNNTIARYDRESRRKPKKPPRDYAPLLRAFFYASVMYLLWMAIHEAVHYLSCGLVGNNARLLSVIPSPSIACDSAGLRMPSEAFIYYMSPYLAAILVMIAFSSTENRLLRLLPYAAFFNLQYNLFVTTLLDGECFGGKNDLMRLIGYAQSSGVDPPVMGMYLYSVYFLVILASVSFIFLYGRDHILPGRRRFYMPASLFYILLYAVSATVLYPCYWESASFAHVLSIARTFVTTTSFSATFALFS